jgi:hypothetical protein
LLDDPNDAFWLAQTYFQMHQYARAERILTRPFRTSIIRSRSREATAEQHMNGMTTANGNTTTFGNGKGKEPAGTPAPAAALAFSRLPVGPAAMIDVAADHLDGVSRLVDMSVACRYLCAQALVCIQVCTRDYVADRRTDASRPMARCAGDAGRGEPIQVIGYVHRADTRLISLISSLSQ